MNPPPENPAPHPLRERAEAAFQKSTKPGPEDSAAPSPAESDRTLRELRVNEIELGMQNMDLHQTQAALAASQAHYFDFYDLAPVGYVSVSEAGLILQANLTTANLLGLSRPQLIGQPLARFIYPADQNTYHLWRAQLAAPNEPLTCELRLVKSDGGPLWMQVAALIAHDADHRPVLRIVLSDITAQKQAEEALRESEERYHTLIDRSPEAITVIRQGRVVFANPAALRLFGATDEEVKDKPVLAFVHPDFQGSVQALAESITSSGEAQRLEMKLITLRGTAVDVEVQGTSIVYEGGPALQLSARDITGQKQAAIMRAHQEAQLRRAEMVAGIGSWEINLTTREAAASANARQLYGLGDGAVTLADIQARPLSEYRAKLDAALRDRVESGRPYDVEFQIRRTTDGQLFDIHSIAEYDAANRTVFGVLHNITSHKQAEAALRKSEMRYRTLFEQATDGIIYLSTDLKVLGVNESFAKMHGYSRAEMQGMNLDQLNPPEAMRVAKERAARLVAGESMHFTVEHYHRDGHVFPLEVSVGLIEIGGEKIIQSFNRDITARTQAEAARQKSEQLYRSILKASPDNITITDMDGHILMVSPVALTMFGYERLEEFLGNPITNFIVPEDRADAAAKFAAMQLGITPGASEYRGIRRDGTTFDLEVKGEIIRDTGQPVNMIFVARDVTARKEVESILRASLLEKEALLREVHHRVKNNLQVISSLLRLESGRTTQPGTKSVLGDMQGRIRSMALLHESLYRSGTFAAVDLGAYLKQIATQAFRTLAIAPGTVQLQLDVASAIVEMDQAMPCGLLVNELVANSLKHGFPAGHTGEVRVELHAVAGGPTLCLQVSDTGVGLPADFEEKRGHSLGLQLVSDLTRQIGGRLEIAPGATFTITFTPQRNVSLPPIPTGA
jgi:PAS domain S-box-containing protein